MAEKNRILVVEDESDIRELMAMHLNREGYEVTEVSDGDEAIQKIKENHWNLIVLDWMLPSMSGLDIAKKIRDSSAKNKTDTMTPILMVTARVQPTDIVLGLEAGADDYIPKPFDLPVFLARVRALLRRSSFNQGLPAAKESALITLGKIELNPDSFQVKMGGKPVHLTHSEFKLLHALAISQGKVLTRDQLIDLVQGEDVSVIGRTIDTHVFGLRKKLGQYGELIETIRGVGYRVRSEDDKV